MTILKKYDFYRKFNEEYDSIFFNFYFGDLEQQNDFKYFNCLYNNHNLTNNYSNNELLVIMNT